MKDRVPTPGQEGRVLITPESGEPFYAKIQMADNPTQDGTPLNMTTLLKNATAALYGLTSEAVPDNVFEKLSNAALISDGGLVGINGDTVGVQISTGSYVGTGTTGVSNPLKITLPFRPRLFFLFHAARGNLWLMKPDNGNTNIYTPEGLGSVSNFGYGVYGTILDDGISLTENGMGNYPINASGVTYTYLAFGEVVTT